MWSVSAERALGMERDQNIVWGCSGGRHVGGELVGGSMVEGNVNGDEPGGWARGVVVQLARSEVKRRQCVAHVRTRYRGGGEGGGRPGRFAVWRDRGVYMVVY